jgi:hypothetical protein
VVARFDEFYRTVIEQYYEQPERRAQFLANPLFDAAFAADRATAMALPLSRLDCVLTDAGELRVIEINPVGVCTIHMRAEAYLARALAQAGFTADARLLERSYDALCDTFERCYAAEARGRRATPTVGVVLLANMHRGSRVTWRQAFRRRRWGYVEGRASELRATPSGLELRGQPVDIVWADFLLYLAYQYARYRQTQFASKMGDYSRAETEAAPLLADPTVLERVRDRSVVEMSPAKSYLAISKHLLSFIHRADRGVSPKMRPWLERHVARTYGADERGDGTIDVRAAMARREGMVLKPCQYGGSHGVVLGRELEASSWAARLEEIWRDPQWVLQELHVPRRTREGEWLSLGLYNFGGRLGAVTIRSGASMVVSARKSRFIPVVFDG